MAEHPTAAYVFRVRFRLDPDRPDARVAPETFETVLELDAAPPGESGWLFFRDSLWRGEVGDEAHLRETAEGILGVAVESVTFSELRTDPEYLEALRAAVGGDLELFNAGTVEEALTKYLGSSIHVRLA